MAALARASSTSMARRKIRHGTGGKIVARARAAEDWGHSGPDPTEAAGNVGRVLAVPSERTQQFWDNVVA
eukprot:15484504-Alexandrium_andersonii.AAC.1